MEKITGKNNSIIKNVKKLLSSSAQRREQGLFVLEGARLVFDILNSFYKIKYFLVTVEAYGKYTAQCNEISAFSEYSFFITNELSEKLGETKNTQGVFAVCVMKTQEKFPLKKGGRYIALDNIQDPGNLGAAVRTAEALGIDGIMAGGGCDIFNPKALRASMGSMLRINIIQTDSLSEYLTDCISEGLPVYASSPDSSALSVTDIDFSDGGVCVIGNEANGVSREITELCDSTVTIKMSGRAESLNASAAAAIIMWEMLR